MRLSRAGEALLPSRRVGARLLLSLLALGLLIAGVAGAYSYGQEYSRHRGFVTIARLPRAGKGRLLNVNFYSPALHRRSYYLVYLPADYAPSRHYPVFYLLHGMPGRPQVWIDIANLDVRLDNQLSQGHLRPMVLVFPDGRIGGSTYSDSEWADTSSGRYESYVVDVVRDVDRRFAVRPVRSDRAIAGFSAGGYGALNIALHHLALFGSVQVWSGYFRQTRSAVFAHASRAQLVYNSPIEYVRTVTRQLRLDPLRVFMFVGRDDQASRQVNPMARALAAAGARARYAIYAGGHDWQVWYPRLNQMLIQASRQFGHPPAAGRRGFSHPGATRRRGFGHPRAAGRRPAGLLARRAWSPAAVSEAPPARLAAPRRAQHPRALFGGLLLALLGAGAINLGFLLQHRGLAGASDPGRNPLVMLRSRSWLAGQAIGWIGFLGQIVAVALAPLSLVQAFAAGGLALSVPLAAGVFRQRVSRRQQLAVVAIALSLATLPIAVSSVGGQPRGRVLLDSVLIAVVSAAVLGARRRASSRAMAAGIFYAVADAAIKADAVNLRAHGSGALLSGWTMLALVSTFGGFLTFQAALRAGNPVSAISAMTALTALTALGFGLLAFGESLGATAPLVIVHLIAISCVLACVPLLAEAQEQMHLADARRAASRRSHRILLAAGRAIAFALILLLSLLTGVGLLYLLRGTAWLAVGSSIADALPLLQLAGLDSQPLVLVAVAWLGAGVILGLAPIRIDPLRRTLCTAAVSLPLLLLSSDAAFALARNLRLSHVLWHRAPGLGPWVEALLVATGCAVPDLIVRRLSAVTARASAARVRVSSRPA